MTPWNSNSWQRGRVCRQEIDMKDKRITSLGSEREKRSRRLAFHWPMMCLRASLSLHFLSSNSIAGIGESLSNEKAQLLQFLLERQLPASLLSSYSFVESIISPLQTMKVWATVKQPRSNAASTAFSIPKLNVLMEILTICWIETKKTVKMLN